MDGAGKGGLRGRVMGREEKGRIKSMNKETEAREEPKRTREGNEEWEGEEE